MTPGFDLSYGHVAPSSPFGSIPGELLAAAINRPDASSCQHSSPRQFAEALSRWQILLGQEHVQFDRETLDRYSRCTLPTSTRPSAVLRPSRSQEVSELVKIAAHYRLPLHPISRGKNWGYGDACAPTDGWIIVDLGRMNRIVEVNEELAYAVVEPGVTQGQMYECLRDNYPSLMLDVTGAGPEASIVGNTLQRGFGHTPYGNHFTHMSGMEVVLPSGQILLTGFGAFDEQAKAQHVFPWGQGPYIDGLFTQSHLGIVTRMGIWLMPKPEVIEAFVFSVPEEGQLGEIVEALRWLKLHDVVKSTVHIANDLRVISAQRSYPYELTGGKTPLPHDIRLKLRREHCMGAWNVMGGLYGTREMVAAAKKVVRRIFAKVARVQFFNRRKLSLAKRLLQVMKVVGLGRHFERRIASAESVYDLLCGIPTRDHLRGSAWRDRGEKPNEEIDPGQSGLIWISPVIEGTAQATARVAHLIAEVSQQHGFEPLLTLSSVTERAFVAVASIHTDRANSDDALVRSKRCMESLLLELRKVGYLTYRTATVTT